MTPLTQSDKAIQTVVAHWNSHKGGTWRCVRDIMPFDKEAIKYWLKEYTVEQICQGIDNYAKVLKGKEYKWSHIWSLRECLSRGKPTDHKEKQFLRWLDFYEQDYLSDGQKPKERPRCCRCGARAFIVRSHHAFCTNTCFYEWEKENG